MGDINNTSPDSATLKKRNAFSELMSPTSKHTKPGSSQLPVPTTRAQPRHSHGRRDGLLAYIQNPTSYPPSRVIYNNKNFVVINDVYPKASIHLLLLPRDPSKYLLHPFTAFEDAAFLASVRAEAAKAKELAAKELQRRFGSYSASDRTRLRAMDEEPPPTTLPSGRDWAAELMVGVHAHPSMGHLHVHIISKDRHSESLRHRKHYNSFSTPFFVPLSDFPLAEDDVRRHPGREGYLKEDFICWRCDRSFGDKFTKLKHHLEREFEEWKKE